MLEPKISIILPTHNVESYIGKALQSCIEQTYDNIEIIVVDDCGNDSSISIAQEFATLDSRIKIIHNKINQGTFVSRNNGVLAANGEYIIFLDPDDTLSIDTCQICLDNIGKSNILRFAFNYIYPSPFTQQSNSIDIDFKSYNEFTKIIFNFTPQSKWTLCRLFIKKSHYLSCVPINIKKRLLIGEDKFIFPLLIDKTYIYLPMPLYNYYIRQTSITNKNNLLLAIKSYKTILDVLPQIKTSKVVPPPPIEIFAIFF